MFAVTPFGALFLVLQLMDGANAESPETPGRPSPEVLGKYHPLAGIDREGRPVFIHRLVGPRGVVTELELDDLRPIAAPGSVLTVRGGGAGPRYRVDSFEYEAPPTAPLTEPTPLPPRKLALILLETAGNQLDITPEEAHSALLSGPESTAAYFAEQSFGRETITGEVFGPYTINWPYGCDSDGIADAARGAMASDGHDPQDFEQFMYVFPSTDACGFVGLAALGRPEDPARDSWYNGSFGCVVRNQEVAHNFGLLHSHAYGCPGGTLFDDCAAYEYGNSYEPMGSGCGHMSAHQKQYMSWLESCNVVTAPADGTFRIVPLELPCDGIQALRVPAYDGRYYYLEYRQPIGFDEGLSGVLINVAGPADYFGPDGYLLEDIGDEGLLRAGDSYEDPQGLVTISVVSVEETHATIDVVFADGGSGAPTCDGGTAPQEQAGVWGPLVCTGGAFPGDETPPIVEIIEPTAEATFDVGASFTIEVQASDDVQISYVSLWLDGVLQSTLTTPPWEWPVDDAPLGDYELFAIAGDGIQETQSGTVVFHVREPGDETSGSGDTGVYGSSGDGLPPVDTGSGGPALPPGLDIGRGAAEGCECTATQTTRSMWLGVPLLLLMFRSRAARSRRCAQ